MYFIPYLIPFILTILLSVILTLIIRKLSLKWGLFDYPSPRKIHDRPIPRLGGVAVFLSFVLVVLGYLIFAPEKLQFVADKIIGIDKNLLGVLLGALILVGAGIYDDIKGLKPLPKFILQLIAVCLVAFFGIKIWWFSNPFGDRIILGDLSFLFVIIWLIAMINVVNFLDGLDGLAPGVSAISALVLFFLSLQPTVNQPATALLCIILAAACLGFLPFNFNPAKIFLGDSGSMFLGYMIGIFAIISGGKVATALLVLGIPIFDAIWVILRRIWGKKAPWIGDRLHLHHRFLEAGFSQKQAVLILYGISLIFGLWALFSQTKGKFWGFLILLLAMILLALLLIYLERRKKHATKETA